MIKHLELINFRNYEQKQFSLDKLTILVGSNGIGKTNVLEALFFLATSKSFRTNIDREMIKRGEDFCRVVGDEKEIAFQINPSFRKELKIKKAKKTLKEFLGQTKIVVFSPESLNIALGRPAERRRFLNLILLTEDIFYRDGLIELGKILKNRNQVLSLIRDGFATIAELDFWTKKLIEIGDLITGKRKKLIDFLNLVLSGEYQNISGEKKTGLKIDFKAADYQKIEWLRGKEIAYKTTLFGPQREDFNLMLDNKNIQSFASRGEVRSAVLALKKCELDYVSQKKSGDLILLLDDVFSELDAERRSHLVAMTKSCQTIVTTTDLDHIGAELKKKAKIIVL